MSIIDSSNHSVVQYVAGVTKPFTGQRLSLVTYRTITDKTSPLYNVKRESKCVSVPLVNGDAILDNIDLLLPHVCAMIADVQNKIIKETIDNGDNVRSIDNASISLSACIEYLEESGTEGRLTKESIAKWFDETVLQPLVNKLHDKLGVEIPSESDNHKINLIVSEFKKNICMLAGGKTSHDDKTCKNLINCLQLAPEGDVLSSKFERRLNSMMDSRKNANLMDALN